MDEGEPEKEGEPLVDGDCDACRRRRPAPSRALVNSSDASVTPAAGSMVAVTTARLSTKTDKRIVEGVIAN